MHDKITASALRGITDNVRGAEAVAKAEALLPGLLEKATIEAHMGKSTVGISDHDQRELGPDAVAHINDLMVERGFKSECTTGSPRLYWWRW